MGSEATDRIEALRQLGKRVATLRKAKGWTKKQLAAAIGRHLKSVYRWEAGAQEMGILDAIAIASVLGTTIHALIDPTAPQILRPTSLFYVSPDRIAKLQAAKTRQELLRLLPLRPPVGVEIEPSDVQVPEAQFHQAQREADKIYDDKTSGPLRRLLQQLRGLK